MKIFGTGTTQTNDYESVGPGLKSSWRHQTKELEMNQVNVFDNVGNMFDIESYDSFIVSSCGTKNGKALVHVKAISIDTHEITGFKWEEVELDYLQSFADVIIGCTNIDTPTNFYRV